MYGDLERNGRVILEDEAVHFDDVPNVVVMQSTGILDMHDKEIFEGDILKYMDCTYLPLGEQVERRLFVQWKEDHWAPLSWGDSCQCCGVDESWENTEIIGNIYQNPELLSNGKFMHFDNPQGEAHGTSAIFNDYKKSNGN